MTIYKNYKTKSTEKTQLAHFKNGSTSAITEFENAQMLYSEFICKFKMLGLHGNKDNMQGKYTSPDQALSEAERIQYNYNQKAKNQTWQSCKKFILIDIDNFDYGKFNLLDLPIIPLCSIVNPDKCQSVQLIFLLNKPVFGNNKKQTDLYNDCFNALNELYSADFQNVGFIAKNPFHQNHLVFWHENSKQYDLEELLDLANYQNLMEPQTRSKTNKGNKTGKSTKSDKTLKLAQQDNKSRNKKLFIALQEIAFSTVSMYFDIENKAYRLQQFIAFLREQAPSTTLEESEIMKTVKSVARYTLNNYDPNFKNNHKYSAYNKQREQSKMEKIQYLKTKYGNELSKRLTIQQKAEIARELDIQLASVTVYLAKARKELKINSESDFDKINKYKNMGLKWAEIATLMDKSVSAIQKMYYRATGKEKSYNDNLDLFN